MRIFLRVQIKVLHKCASSRRHFSYIGYILGYRKHRLTQEYQVSGFVCVNSLLYADYKVIIKDTEDKLQKAVFNFHNIRQCYGLTIPAIKSKAMAFER